MMRSRRRRRVRLLLMGVAPRRRLSLGPAIIRLAVGFSSSIGK